MNINKIDIDKELYVIDGLFSYDECYSLYITASEKALYLNYNYDSGPSIDTPHLKKWRSDLNLEEARTCANFPLVLEDVLKNQIVFDNNINIEVKNSYINYSTSITVDRVHCDRFDNEVGKKYYTALIYGNCEWHPDWKGETVFYNDSVDEIIYSSMVKPGRLVIFDSTIPHSATAPTIISKYARYTYATKICVSKDI